MHVLVVDDDVVSAEFLANTLVHFGYEVTVASNGREAFHLIRSGKYSIVISDWEMPEMNGPELCRQIRCRQWSGYIFFILITSYGAGHVVEGLKAGADDFLTKPFQPSELRVRLRTGERILSLQSRDVMLFTLAKLAESRDTDTGLHLERIREYCRILSEELSTWDKYRDVVDGDYVQLMYLTSPLHDIGKVGIPDSVLLKPGPLTKEEFEIMKQHVTIGGETLAAATKAHPDAKFLSMARDIAFTHHERYDGTGYPFGLQGKQIPLCGRLTALSDVYDALRSQRVYKPKFSHEKARQIILDGIGTQFDPDVVEAFLRREDEVVRVSEALDSEAESSPSEPSEVAPAPPEPALA